MGEITQRRNFEMMRSNLKGTEPHISSLTYDTLALVFGKPDVSPTKFGNEEANNQDNSNNGTNSFSLW